MDYAIWKLYRGKDVEQLLQPDIAIVTLFAFALCAAKSAPMFAMQVKRNVRLIKDNK